MAKSKYKAVIFDFDDTLADSRAQKWAHHKHVAKNFYNIELTDENIREHWGKPLDTLISELYQKRDSLEKMYENLISVRDNFLKQPYEGAADVVKNLIKDGIKVGILSATNKKYLVEDVNRLIISAEEITVIQGADETEVHKPHPDVFLPLFKSLKKEGINKNEMVYIGDSLYDLQAAHGAGIDFIGVTTGLYSEEDLKKAGAKVVVKNINEVLKHLI